MDFVWNGQTLQNQLACFSLSNSISVWNLKLCVILSISVGQPFQGAYLEINKNPKYKKLKDAIEEKIIIAEIVNKINRANGKVKLLIVQISNKHYLWGWLALVS